MHLAERAPQPPHFIALRVRTFHGLGQACALRSSKGPLFRIYGVVARQPTVELACCGGNGFYMSCTHALLQNLPGCAAGVPTCQDGSPIHSKRLALRLCQARAGATICFWHPKILNEKMRPLKFICVLMQCPFTSAFCKDYAPGVGDRIVTVASPSEPPKS